MGKDRINFLGGSARGAVIIGDHANLSDGETITIGNRVYEWDDNASVTDGNIGVTIGADAAEDIENLVDAINAYPPEVNGIGAIEAKIDSKTTSVARLEGRSAGTNKNLAMATDMADADNIISGSAMTGGENLGKTRIFRGVYVVTALDVLADNIEIPVNNLDSDIDYFQLECRDVNGVLKAITAKVTVAANRILVNFDGATDPVATDKLYWIAFKK